MTIWRFKSHEEAQRAMWLEPDDPSLVRRIQAAWSLARLSPLPSPVRGVKKYHSIEEAEDERKSRALRRTAE
ncbi:MAG: hypothetical protein RDV48_20440 [Candidatus Eremiobacteraeota bacterium]|nr:hypothetical protein [Candidatus Eremiobacteraeota bacterium]